MILSQQRVWFYKPTGFLYGSVRLKSSGSSNQWLNRQHRDRYVQLARGEEYRSRAAYKLHEIDRKFKIFRPGQTVVDLGFAPGSWSQVAVEQTQPGGRVIGVDLLPVEPPEGVSAIQGNFLDPGVQSQVRKMLDNYDRGRYRPNTVGENTFGSKLGNALESPTEHDDVGSETPSTKLEKRRFRSADVVISDMCGIWPQQTGFWTNSINTPYRLANTSGVVARDHASSMDLCDAALVFCISNLRYGGSFICKFYTGTEDRDLEARLKRVFKQVNRVKPDASRAESREAYFVARKKQKVESVEEVFTN